MTKKILLLGAGAQAKYAAEIYRLTGDAVSAVMDLNTTGLTQVWPDAMGLPLIPFDETFDSATELGTTHVLVCCNDNEKKQKLTRLIESKEFSLVNAIHPEAIIASTARLGDGVIINAGAIVQPFACVGNGVMVHANVVIDHDCEIGDFVNLAPNVTLAGWVKIHKFTTVYSGAIVIPKVSISNNCIIAAGSVVIKNTENHSTTIGVPGRALKEMDSNDK